MIMLLKCTECGMIKTLDVPTSKKNMTCDVCKNDRFEVIPYMKEYTIQGVEKSIKPPLGVMPRKLFIEDRIQDLTRALYERSYYKVDDCMKEWSNELNHLLKEWSDIK